MAKKKVSRKSNGASDVQNQTAPVIYQKSSELSREYSMEDSEEKFHNLKSLNAILLKQTMEKRQQIESLFQAKETLEAELVRSGTEKSRLSDELCGLSDESFMSKLEMDLFICFVESLVKEMSVGVEKLVKEKSDRECEVKDLKREGQVLMGKLESERKEFIRVCDERDSIKSGFDLQCEETNRLKESVVQMEMKEKNLGEEVGKLKSENDRMVKKMKKREELINKEKTNLEKNLEEKISKIDELKRETEELLREKMEMEMTKRDQKETIMALEKKLEDLNGIVQCLTKEENGLRNQVIGLEKNLVEVIEKVKAKEEHINALVEEKSMKESELEGLLKENNSIKTQMEMALVQSSDKEKLVDQLVREKNELVERIVNQEAEFFELSKLADERKDIAVQLRKDFDDQTKTNENLSCKLSKLKNNLAFVEVERDNARKTHDEDKKNRVALKEKVTELEKVIKATNKEVEKIKSERNRLNKEKKELENRSESLRKEKGILQNDVAELKRAMSVLKTDLESVRAKDKQCLTMLKSVSSLVSGIENKKGEQKRVKGLDMYSLELEEIKKAFNNKETIVKEMKKEVEIMKHSMEDAHEKKRFWSLVSSVTTLFMVASAAYAAMIK